MMEVISQIMIFIFSGFGAWALAERKHKLGFILGLLGEPFWIYSSLIERQWGIFLVALWFTYQNARGWYTHKGEAL